MTSETASKIMEELSKIGTIVNKKVDYEWRDYASDNLDG